MLMPSLLKLKKRGVKVTISTRDPEEGDTLHLVSYKALSVLLHEGIHVMFTKGLHRKIALIDGGKLWEGNLNILSQNNSREIMCRTKSKELCSQMQNFIGPKK